MQNRLIFSIIFKKIIGHSNMENGISTDINIYIEDF